MNKRTENPSDPAKYAKDFTAYIYTAAREIPGTGRIGRINESAPFGGMDYDLELQGKKLGLSRFWKDHSLPGTPEKIIPSPLPRNYRATSKRRLIKKKNRYYLLLDPQALPERYAEVSPLEHRTHGDIFIFLSGHLNSGSYKLLAESLNYVIIRESEGKSAVIFNIHSLNSQVVRKIKLLVGHLEASELPVLSVFFYFDPTKSDYYFEANRPEDSLGFRKVSGPPRLMLRVGEAVYFYGPTVFCQVNPQILPALTADMARQLQGITPPRLVDLYCGFGLFALSLGQDYPEVYGMEANGEAIKNAWENSKAFAGKARYHFRKALVNPRSLESFLPTSGSGEIIILDPPRGGTESGVIPWLGSRKPSALLHLFCNPDILPLELGRWKNQGYFPKSITPYDMFPGTPGLEICVHLTKGK